MQLLQEHDYHTLPEPVEEGTATLIIYPRGNPEKVPDSYGVHVQRMTLDNLISIKSKLPSEAKIVGVPCYWALGPVEGIQRLFLWPAPEREMYARLRFCPPMKEI